MQKGIESIDYHTIIVVHHLYTLLASRLNVGILKKYGYRMWNCGFSVYWVYVMCVCENIYRFYIYRNYFSHTFLLFLTLSFQAATCISGMAIVTVNINSTIICISRTPISQVEPITFLYGMIDNCLQELQRENKSSVCGIKIMFKYSVNSLNMSMVICN